MLQFQGGTQGVLLDIKLIAVHINNAVSLSKPNSKKKRDYSWGCKNIIKTQIMKCLGNSSLPWTEETHVPRLSSLGARVWWCLLFLFPSIKLFKKMFPASLLYLGIQIKLSSFFQTTGQCHRSPPEDYLRKWFLIAIAHVARASQCFMSNLGKCQLHQVYHTPYSKQNKIQTCSATYWNNLNRFWPLHLI